MVDWVCIYMYTGEDSLGSNPELLIVHPKVTGGGGGGLSICACKVTIQKA